MNEFDMLWELIHNNKDQYCFQTCFYIRLNNALNRTNTTTPKDIAALFRGVLRNEAEKQGGNPPVFRVPRSTNWPDRALWSTVGISIEDEDEISYTVRAHPWNPEWLDSGSVSPEAPLFYKEPRQFISSAPGDPFLSVMGRSNYRCQGQGDAIRSILTAPTGSTLVVNLPTGSGKSLCAQLPALISSSYEGVSVIVVPTVALAIDQEFSISNFVAHPTAYYSGREVENEGILTRIIDGTQRVVFTSPESLMQSLMFPLQLAAERGFFRYLFIDEAHMIELWGDEFRPAFQELSGWRKHMMRIDPEIRTVLLSATITESSLDAMETLFSSPGPFMNFSAVHVRSEPAYWFKSAQSEEEKQSCVLEAINHLPRPLILYTSKVEDAEHWEQVLRDTGYGRLRVMTGKTPNRDRESIVSAWKNREIDIVVATSAFGLGVDQPDVRAVIHACIPESLDRYYQEVGRGGRDGNASMSLVIYTKKDIEVADEMSGKMLITVKRGMQRWTEMFRKKHVDPRYPGYFLVPIEVSPSQDENDIDMGGSIRNSAWNIRTLNLMVRSGLIEMDWEKWEGSDTGVEYKGYSHRVIRVLEGDHLLKLTWDRLVEPLRQESYRLSAKHVKLMKHLLLGEQCVNEVFREVYQIAKRDDTNVRKGTNVQLACGGCPYCRKVGHPPFTNQVNSLPVHWESSSYSLNSVLGKRLDESNQMVIFYPAWKDNDFGSLSSSEHEKWVCLLRWFIDNGIQQLVVSNDVYTVLRNHRTINRSEILFMSNISDISSKWVDVPTLIVHPSSERVLSHVNRVLLNSVHKLAMVTLLPENLTERESKHRKLKDTLHRNKYSWKEFFTEVGL